MPKVAVVFESIILIFAAVTFAVALVAIDLPLLVDMALGAITAAITFRLGIVVYTSALPNSD